MECHIEEPIGPSHRQFGRCEIGVESPTNLGGTKMIKRWLKLGYVIVALGLLFAQYALAMPADDDYAVLLSLGYFASAPPEPQLSSDGKTLYNARSPVVVVADPNPSLEAVHIPPPFDLLTHRNLLLRPFQSPIYQTAAPILGVNRVSPFPMRRKPPLMPPPAFGATFFSRLCR